MQGRTGPGLGWEGKKWKKQGAKATGRKFWRSQQVAKTKQGPVIRLVFSTVMKPGLGALSKNARAAPPLFIAGGECWR